MRTLIILFIALSVVSCKKKSKLPAYGTVNIPYEFIDQEGRNVNAKTWENKVYVADFFFTHCPSICVKMSEQMLRVQEAYKNEDDLKLVSFSIDVERDSIPRLKWYADKVGVDPNRWIMLRGNQADVDSTSARMKVFQQADKSAPGGFNHAGYFILVDKTGTFRGFYNGTDSVEVDKLIKDLKPLL